MTTQTPETPPVIADPNMDSAGAELMNLAWRMKDHPEFAADADRIREIGGWAMVGRPSDMERMIAPVLGQLIGAMRNRGIAFDEELPMSPQLTGFLESLPDPLPGQQGYVDQTTLSPVDRRDAFEATIEMIDVRKWSSGADDAKINHVIARECVVRPVEGVEGRAMVFARDDDVDLFEEGKTATLWLRSAGQALTVVPPAPIVIEPERNRWEQGPVTWDELVNRFYTLRLTLEKRLEVTVPWKQVILDVELRAFTCEIFERLKRVNQ